jgi:hypothetical protein
LSTLKRTRRSETNRRTREIAGKVGYCLRAMENRDLIIKFNVSAKLLKQALDNVNFAVTQKFLVYFALERNLN